MTLRFNNISHAFDDTPVLSNLNLLVNPGEITCLLGPSGGGKSTLLCLAAGLEPIQAGTIEVDGQVLASPNLMPPPEKRPIGMMFQENALFPHLTVEENVAFGLNHLKNGERHARVLELLELVGLAALADRYPHQLSGGQQQRIALVRSLAPQPRVLLMDEPYASIDITLRRSLREAARHTLKRSGTTAIMVTHDPPEAMEMADVIAVLDGGNIVQQGSPEEIYERPAAVSVAALFGDAQRIEAECVGNKFITPYGEILNENAAVQASQGVCDLVVRPRGFHVISKAESSLKIIDLRYVGDGWLAFLSSDQVPVSAEPIRVEIDSPNELSIGDGVQLSAGGSGFFVFPKN